MMRRLVGPWVLATLVLAAGCDSDGGGEASATPSASASPTSTVFVLDRSTPTPSPAARPSAEVQHTVWLINLWEDEQYTIYEHPDLSGMGTTWSAPRIARVGRGSGPGFYGQDGRPLSLGGIQCRPAESGVVVGGVERPEVSRCGRISPDGRYMLYEHVTDAQVYPPVSQQWALHIGSGTTRLLEARLMGCGGCDGRFGPQWSPDGRYVLFAETVQDGRVFLADLETGTSEVIASGTDVQFRPSWSSDDSEPLFLVRGEDGQAVLANAATGERTALPIGWPATFDATGTLAYSPSAGFHQDEPEVTSVVDLTTFEVSDIEGLAPWQHLWVGDVAVAAQDPGDGFTAALEQRDCAGTMVYSNGIAPTCVEGAYGGTPSWSGRQVAFALLVPGEDVVFKGTRFSRYDIAVLDVQSGDVEVVAEGAYSGPLPPRIQWSRFGDLLLVSWPQFAGL